MGTCFNMASLKFEGSYKEDLKSVTNKDALDILSPVKSSTRSMDGKNNACLFCNVTVGTHRLLKIAAILK